jgi:pantoate--beta-alanine ligase
MASSPPSSKNAIISIKKKRTLRMTVVLKSLEELQNWKNAQASKKNALVPTMGNLHAGHLALVKEAKQHADAVIVSIFVNPTQFGANEDLDRYPRTFEADVEACQNAQVDAIFAPSVEVMYPDGLKITHHAEESLANRLCGASRKGHFDGVVTVVHRLFSVVEPQLAVFGQKDAQQVTVIKALIESEAFPIKLVVHPVVRDTDGLALSSRNQYLQTPEERQTALALFETMQGLAVAFHTLNQAPTAPTLNLQKAFELSWKALQPMYPLGQELQWDYVEAVDDETFEPQAFLTSNSRLLVAARLGSLRLIDTLHIEELLTESQREGLTPSL